jgi:hypothetical protein
MLFYFIGVKLNIKSKKIGDWGLGIGDWAQSTIPNPQSTIPNPQLKCFKNEI